MNKGADMKRIRILIAALLMAGLARAADPTYHTTLDSHHTGDKWKIDNLYIGDTPILRFHLRENGVAWTATSSYGATFWYGTDGLNSTSIVAVTGVGTGETYIDIATTGATFASNSTYTCGLTVTNSAGTYTKTWGDGKLVVKKSPGTGAASALTLTTPFPLDQYSFTGNLPLANLQAPTAWRMLYSDGAPSWAELALGTAGQVLTSQGAGAAPTWSAAGAGDMVGASNLSDVASAATSRTNLGLGTAAQSNATDFATGAEGDLASTALQPDGDGSGLSGVVTAEADTLQTVVTRGGEVTSGTVTIDSSNQRNNTYGGATVTLGSKVQSGGATASGTSSHAAGLSSTASGGFSRAIGRSATASHDNTYVWSDGTATGSTTSKQYTVHSDNGIRLFGAAGVEVEGPHSAASYAGDGNALTNLNLSAYAGTNLTWDGTQLNASGGGGGSGFPLTEDADLAGYSMTNGTFGSIGDSTGKFDRVYLNATDYLYTDGTDVYWSNN